MATLMGVSPEAVSAMADNVGFQERSKLVLDMFHDHVRMYTTQPLMTLSLTTTLDQNHVCVRVHC